MIADNLKRIRENIERASGGREVELVAVTKNRTEDEIRELYSAGQRVMAENRVQEYVRKECMFDDVRWDIIGNLQKNKLKYIVGKVRLIHSVESLDLAEAIGELSEKRGVTSSVLIETNVSGESSKHGCRPEDLDEMIECAGKIKGIKVEGIMTVAPDTENTAYLSGLFEKTRNIFDKLMQYNSKSDNIDIKILSMGMSHDYIEAVKNGSTMVRIGTALFL